MPRPAPSVSRVVEVLNLLGDSAPEPATLSSVARRLDLNKATAHGILTVLLDRGYVIRDKDDGSYALGAALTSVGRAAMWRQYEAVRVARLEMEELADTRRVRCSGVARIGDALIVIAVTGIPSAATDAVIGARRRFLPPLGNVWATWGEPGIVEQWLIGEPMTDEERSTIRGSLAATRDRGFSVTLHTPHRTELEQFADSLVNKPGTENIHSAIVRMMSEMVRDGGELGDIRPNGQYMPRQISAPVFDENGDVVIGLYVQGREVVSGAELHELGFSVSSAAARVTRMIGGRVPGADGLTSVPAAA
jgi:DNA-binding IclR family transcriptional regulator